jgi:hypothetical protein
VTKPDPIVEAVRRVRAAHAAKFGYDLAAICKDFSEREKAAGHPVVRRAPKLRLKKTGS